MRLIILKWGNPTMFKSFYGMTLNPFDKSLPENHAFRSKDHEQMLSRLDYLKNTRGIGLFTAPPGMGKTFALRCFCQSLNPNLYQLSYICLSTVSVTEFYQQFQPFLAFREPYVTNTFLIAFHRRFADSPVDGSVSLTDIICQKTVKLIKG
jgi:hypothetical protein